MIAAAHIGYSWVDHPALRAQLLERTDKSLTLALTCPAMHCATCAERIEQLLSERPEIADVTTNVARRSVKMVLSAEDVTLAGLLNVLHEAGFPATPVDSAESRESQALRKREHRLHLKRLGVAGIGLLQVMSYSLALYLAGPEGLSEGIEQLLRYAAFIVCTPLAFYSARPFLERALNDARAAWRERRATLLSMDVPIALAIGTAWTASTVNVFRGTGDIYFDSVLMFTFLLLGARFLERSLRDRLADQIALGDILPPVAQRRDGENWREVPAIALQVNDQVLIRNGETIVADGIILHGASQVDESIVTGESRPRRVAVGDRVLAGSLNADQSLEICVERMGVETRVGSLARLAARASQERPAVVERADRVARYFVLFVLAVALATAFGWSLVDASATFPAVLAVLVVSCPCALALATPAAHSAALQALRTIGLAVARGDFIERATTVEHVVFDKTGTLTTPQSSLLAATTNDHRALSVAAALEAGITHPLAAAVRNFARRQGVEERHATEVLRSPNGVTGVVNGERWSLRGEDGRLELFACDTNQCVAQWRVQETIEPSAQPAVAALAQRGLSLSILSGDSSSRVSAVAQHLGIDEGRGDANPEAKLASLRSQAIPTLLIGDGFNDVPALAGAHASIAMPGGSDLAQVSADAILLRRDLMIVPRALAICSAARNIVRQNLLWALVWNVTAIPAAALGLMPAWAAALGMSASSLLVTLNSMRLLRPSKADPGPGLV